MENDSDIPLSTEVGRGQHEAVVSEVLPKLTHRLPQSVPDTINAMAESRTRGITNDALQLTSAYMSEARGRVDELKSDLRASQQRSLSLEETLKKVEIENAQLKADAYGQRRLDNIFKGIGIVSAALCGVGTDLVKGQGDIVVLGCILIAIGISGVVASCISFREKKTS
jgi:hypothetical protein